MRQNSVNFGLALLCFGLLVSSTLVVGCSKDEKKMPSKKEKPVVTTMDIKTETDGDSTATPPKKDAVESLPFETEKQESSEEELPILGGGE